MGNRPWPVTRFSVVGTRHPETGQTERRAGPDLGLGITSFQWPSLGMVIDSGTGMRVLTWLRQDVRDALRSLRRTRTLTFAAIATLALGIGATTAIFSLVEAVLLRRLPVAAPDRLYFITHGANDILSTASHYPWFERIKQIEGIFDGVAAYNIRDFKVSSSDGVERIVGQYVSGNYHAVIGAPLQLGRGFSAEDDRMLTPIAVISHGYWSRRFGRSHGRDRQDARDRGPHP